MTSRLELQALLEEILNSKHVYFQPPESVKMQYDAIVYSRKNLQSKYANNSIYNQRDCYEVTVIYRNPDSDIPRKISKLPLCRFDRHYNSDNLNHDVFTLYY